MGWWSSASMIGGGTVQSLANVNDKQGAATTTDGHSVSWAFALKGEILLKTKTSFQCTQVVPPLGWANNLFSGAHNLPCKSKDLAPVENDLSSGPTTCLWNSKTWLQCRTCSLGQIA